jgi:uncharacterized phage protein (TIGR01671 family)
MRLAKYRSWISSIQQFVYFENGNYSWIRKTDNVNVFNWDNAQQFTGLLDKNSVEIYEGDIVNNQGNIQAVVYQAPEFVMKDKIKRSYSKVWCNFIKHPRDNQFQEVIGNIYENKELLG